MSTGVEAFDAMAWVGLQLTTDSAFMAACPGGAHLGVAPPLTTVPVAGVYTQSAQELTTFNGNHIMTDVSVMVKVMGPKEQLVPTMRNVAKRVYAVLSRHTGIGVGAEGSVIGCILTQQFPLAEPQLVAGVQWISLVQIYRVLVQ